ncbi:MAG: AraC family transcriptional regulator [Roseburia sp.]|nr:AraC family transcriptional regulator [Roseburia sp.]MCM1242085.1 AraC family transcriptional regulator [Roseburia sp.]
MKTLYEYNASDLQFHHVVDENPDPADFTMHIHETFEIYLFLSGAAVYMVEGTEYPLLPGCILIMRAAETHMVKILDHKRYERYYLNFLPSVLENFDPRYSLCKAFVERPLGRDNLFYPADFDMLRPHDCFRAMCADSLEGYDKRIQILTYLLPLLNSIKNIYTEKEHHEQRVSDLSAQIVTYINLHLFEELSVPVIAGQFFISTSQLERIFKKATGSSVWEYITLKRLTSAREKIREGLPAHRVSEECGFGDYSSFYRAYVRRFGKAPTYE